MKTKTITIFSGLIVLLCGLMPVSGYSLSYDEIQIDSIKLSPNDTVILSNEVDAKFVRDYSVLLKNLKPDWIIMKKNVVPDSIKTKNVIVIGHPDAKYVGDVIQDLVTADQRSMLQDNTEDYDILQMNSPWMEGRTIFICSAIDQIIRRNAAEEVLNTIITNAPPSTDWIQTTYDMTLDSDLREYISQLRYTWEDSELPLKDLLIDLDAEKPRKINSQQAAEDTERLFYLLSHGYSGFAFFNNDNAFLQAKTQILESIQSQSSWTYDALSNLFYDHLRHVIDSHLAIGEHKYASHKDFWYDTHLEIKLTEQGYQFVEGRTVYTINTVNNKEPTSYLFPSLNKQGEAIYRIGLLSKEKPLPLQLIASDDQVINQFEVKLKRSDFEYYSEDIFSEEILAGIPVVRVRTFGDYYEVELNEFVKTAKRLKAEPVIIVDLRGNGGGNERWPIRWIQELTGQRAEAVLVTSELESKTSMVGRANAFKLWIQMGSDSSFNLTHEKSYTHTAEMFENGERQVRWTTPRFPEVPLIDNNTTVIVITNDLVASAGEGFVMRLSQAENVVVVGENTMGALTFGNISIHQLPNSKMQVRMPININIFIDKEFREEIGLTPDLWVPAQDAVNYTVAALRSGTISTDMPLPINVPKKIFVHESLLRSLFIMDTRSLLLIAILATSGGIWAYFMRKKVIFSLIIGFTWIAFSYYRISLNKSKPLSLGFLFAGIICLISGLISFFRSSSSKGVEG